MRQLFGTDGIRGTAGEYPLNPPTMYALGVALARWIGSHHLDPEVVLGMDTRESGPWIAEHLAGGLAEGGVKARSAGLITTPGLAYTARTGPFAAGMMISASHNPYQDNGVKIFNHSGFKLPDKEEHQLEQLMFEWIASGAEPKPQHIHHDAGLDEAYVQFLRETLPEDLNGLCIAIDPANGAATHLAPQLFTGAGAKVRLIHNAPDGRNINLHCGSQHLEDLKKEVLSSGADFGVAFDGDADRAMFVSHSGKTIDGDAVLLLTGIYLKEREGLKEVVATVMSNLGLERAFSRHGIRMLRTPVGDKYVLEEMLRCDAPLGGEQSGHVIYRKYATTGDGMLTALRVCEVLTQTGKTLDELTAELETFPQLLVNVRVKEKRPLEELRLVQEEIARAEEDFGDAGRVLVRFSGTEPLARVMVEGDRQDRVERWANSIADTIRAELGS